MKKKLTILISIFLPILFVDQYLKYLTDNHIALFHKITVIRYYFNIVHVDNAGIAFGLMNSYSSLIIIILTALIIIFVTFILFRLKVNSGLFIVSLSLVIAGAFSNLLSRVLQGYVVDFLDFHLYNYHWPSFNIADSSVVVGTILFFISVVKYV